MYKDWKTYEKHLWSYLNKWAIISKVEELVENVWKYFFLSVKRYREVGILLQLSFPNMILISFLPPSPTFRPDLSIYHLFRFSLQAKSWIFSRKNLAGKHQGWCGKKFGCVVCTISYFVCWWDNKNFSQKITFHCHCLPSPSNTYICYRHSKMTIVKLCGLNHKS